MTLIALGIFQCVGFDLGLAQTPFWTRTNGPEGATVWALASDSGQRFFAGMYHGGIYRSLDEGQTWHRIGPPGTQAALVSAIAINSSDEIFMFANGPGLGIYKSTDHGDTWAQKNNGFDHWDVRDIEFHPSNEDHIFLGTYDGGIYRSTDGGENWVHVYERPQPGTPVCVHEIAASPKTGSIYAAFGGCGGPALLGLYKSTDMGDTWAGVGYFEGNLVRSAAVDPNTGYVYVSVGCYDRDQGFYRSMNDGASWELLVDTRSSYCAVHSWGFDSSGSMYVGTYQGRGVFKSTDDGANWEHLGPSATVNALVIQPDDDIFAGTTVFGVYRSDAGGTSWTPVNSGLLLTDVRSLAINPAGRVFAGTWGLGVPYTDDRGEHWTPGDPHMFGETVAVNDVFIGSDGKMYGGGPYIFSSLDNGESWTIEADLGLEIYGFAEHEGTLYAASKGIYCKEDGSSNWDGPIGLVDFDVLKLVIDSEGHMFAGTYRNGLWRHLDNETGWEQVGVISSESWIMSLAVKSDGVIFAGVNVPQYGTWRSVDEGNTWDEVLWLTASALAINVEGQIFAGTYNGEAYRSLDNGDSWEILASGLSGALIRDLAFDPSGYLYAGTWGTSVFRSVETTLSDPVVLISELIETVEQMNLKQGIANSLDAKLENARKALESAKDGNRQDTANKLEAFINECEAQRGKALTDEQADLLVSRASLIIELLQGV